MKNQLNSVVVGIAVIVLAGGAWMVMPGLQSPERVVNARADEAAERARRIVGQLDPQREVMAEVSAKAGFSDEAAVGDLPTLVENEPKQVESALDEQAEQVNALLRDVNRRLSELDQRMVGLAPAAEAPPRSPVRFGPSAEKMTRDMTDALKSRARLDAATVDALSDAEKTVATALRDSEGEATAADNLLANRILGGTLHQQGLAARRQAALLRQDARAALADVSIAVAGAEAQGADAEFAQSGVMGDAIARQTRLVADTETRLGEIGEQAAALAARIGDLQKQIDVQLGLAEEARAMMEALESRGLRYEEPDAVEKFRQAYEGYAATYRDTARQAQTLQYGTLENARLDDSGDYLNGRFIPTSADGEIQYEPGLNSLERELAALESQRHGVEQSLSEARETLQRLQELRSQYEARAAKARDALADYGRAAQEGFDRYVQVATRAAAAEDEAVDRLEQAARAFQKVRTINDRRTREAPEGLSPEALEQSPYSLIREDGWFSAQARCEAADAQVSAALVLHDRYTETREALAVLTRATQRLSITGFDRGGLEAAMADAKSKGVALLNDAVESYETAHRDFKQHWSVVASAAAADYALAAFGDPEMLQVAIRNYQNVVKDRENDPLVRPYVERLEQLRNR